MASHRDPAVCTRVQDAYSLRCSPQVHGAARDTVDYARTIAFRELASAVDNPVITDDGRVESNGNFHGAPVAYVLDFLAIAVADVASISERRTDRALDPARSHGLPPFLAHEVGVDSGLMIAQYAAAGIVSELKRLAVPASVDSIPSSAMQEDHVSMGWAAARKLRRGIDGLARVLAIEVLTAARALDLRAPLQPGPATGAVRDLVRTVVDGPGADRYLSPDMEAVTALVASGAVARRRARRAPQPLRTVLIGCSRRRRRKPFANGPGRDRDDRHDRDATVRAARGAERTAKSWGAEAAKRMLMNNLDPEVAEHPEDLVVYGGTGKAARSWEAFDAIVRTLDELEPDETLLVQSGKPVGVFRTHEWAPRVLIANSNLVGDWATWPEFRRLEDLGLTMYGQMTAGSWIYIGTQGILQGTYETFAAVAALARARVARRHADAHRRMRRHGRRAAARRDDERRSRAHRRRRRVAPRAPGRARLPRRVHDRPRRGDRARRRREDGRRGAVGRGGRQRGRGVRRPAAARRADRHRHRPDERPRPARLPAGRHRVRGLEGRGRARPGGASPPGRAAAWPSTWRRWSDSRMPAPPSSTTATPSAARRELGGFDAGVRVPGLRAGLHPAAVRRGQGAVPLGGAVGGPRGHRARPTGPSRSSSPTTPRCIRWLEQGRREGALRGAAGAHLLARLQGAPPRGAEVQRDGRLGRAVGARS